MKIMFKSSRKYKINNETTEPGNRMLDSVELCVIKTKPNMYKKTEAAQGQIGQSSTRADISLEGVKSLAERLYGITALEVEELAGYEDRNFKIIEDPNIKNPLILNHSPSGYVLKVANAVDSQQLSFFESQNELMNYLGHHMIKCPIPFRNVYGHQFTVELIKGQNHVIRLLDYQDGETLDKVSKSEFLFYQLGEYVANLDRVLKNYNHTGLNGVSHIWMLENLSQVEKFKSSVKDADLLPVIDQVLKKFQDTVVPLIPDLEKGLIHGDINGTNIVMKRNTASGKTDDWRISAILDFGDVSRSCYVFELAIAMSHMMRLTGDLNTGGFVLAGYSINRVIPQEEYNLLKISVAARLCQKLLANLYTLERVPDDKTLIEEVKASKALLLQLWSEDDEEVLKNWKKIADHYLTRSKK